MGSKSRREFMAGVSASVAATAVVARPALAAASSRSIKVGLIGCGGRGTDVANTMAKVPGVTITHVCDPNRKRLAKAAKQFSIREGKAVSDMRRVFDDQAVDAVLVATPDHWHAPAAILACDARKHESVAANSDSTMIMTKPGGRDAGAEFSKSPKVCGNQKVEDFHTDRDTRITTYHSAPIILPFPGCVINSERQNPAE